MSRAKRVVAAASSVNGKFVGVEWAERTLRRANAVGFATLDEYIANNFEKDPIYCRARFKRYNDCIKENAGNKAACDYLPNNCKGFKRNAP